MARTILLSLVLRLVAIALAIGVLYGLVLTERFVLAVLPPEAGLWWSAHQDIQPLVDIPIALAALAGVMFVFNMAARKLGVSQPANRPQR